MEATTCPICFDCLEGKIKASPNTCDHVFCLSCLEKWAKLGSFCPVDRKRFKKIVNLESENQIQVKPRKRKRVKTVYDFSSVCEVCQEDSQHDVLLLCDCCDLAFHLFCLTPPLKAVPFGLWFCPTCISVEAKLKEKKGITKDVEADLCNAKQQIEEANRQSDITNILTSGEKQNSGEESANSGKESNLDKLGNVGSLNNEQCSSTFKVSVDFVPEFQNVDVVRNCSQYISSCNSNSNNSVDKKDETKSCSSDDGIKNVKTYVKHKKKKRERLKVPAQYEMYKLCNSKPKNSSIDDMCHKNDISKDVSLLDDGFSQAVVYGDMKGEISEENADNIFMTEVDSFVNEEIKNKNSHSKEYGLSSNVKFRKLVCEINSYEREAFQHYPEEIVANESYYPVTDSFPKQKIQENTKPKDSSDGNDSLLPCSSISTQSNKEGNKSEERNNMLHTHLHPPKDGLTDITLENILSGKKNIVCAVKSHAHLNSQHNCFYFNFCSSQSSKSKVNISEHKIHTSTSSNKCVKSCEKNSTLNTCGASQMPEKDKVNFGLKNLEFSEKSKNEDQETCQLSGRTKFNISYHQNETVSNISAFEEKDEHFNDTVSRHHNEIPFINRSNLKYLVIRDDGSFYLDLPVSKNTESNDSLSEVSERISDTRENMHITSSNVKCTGIKNNENFFLKCTTMRNRESLTNNVRKLNSAHNSEKSRTFCHKDSLVNPDEREMFFHHHKAEFSPRKSRNFSVQNLTIKDDKSAQNQLQEFCSSYRSYKKEISEYHNSKDSAIQNDGISSLDYTPCDNEESVTNSLQKSGSCDNENSRKTIHHSDLKHLILRSDGTFFLDCPEHEDRNIKKPDGSALFKSSAYAIQSETELLHKSDSSDSYKESKTFCRSNLKYLMLRNDGTFFLDCPEYKNLDIKNLDALASMKSSAYSRQAETSTLLKSDSSDYYNESKSICHSDLNHLSLKNEDFIIDRSTSEDVKSIDKPSQKSVTSDSVFENKSLCHSDLKYLMLRNDGTFFLDCPEYKNLDIENSDALASMKSSAYSRQAETSTLLKSDSSDYYNESKSICHSDLNHLSLKNEDFIIDRSTSEDVKSIDKPSQKSVTSDSVFENKSLCHSDLKYLMLRNDGTFFLDCPEYKNLDIENSDALASMKSSAYSRQAETSTSLKSDSSDYYNESKSICHSDLNHLNLKNEEDFIVDHSISKDVKLIDKPSQKSVTSDSVFENKSLSHSDLKHLTIRSDGTFFLNSPD